MTTRQRIRIWGATILGLVHLWAPPHWTSALLALVLADVWNDLAQDPMLKSVRPIIELLVLFYLFTTILTCMIIAGRYL